MKKILLILLLLSLFIGNVYAVGSSGSTGGEYKVYAGSVKIESNPGKLRIGDKYTFKAKLDPINASSDGITWTSSDSNILSIDNNGNAVAKNKGTVKVTVKTNNGKTDSIAVTVILANTTSGGIKKVKTVSITSYPDEMIVGNTFQLQTKITPSLVDNNKLTYKSSDEKILTVDSNGLVTAKKKGSATVTVTSVNNKHTEVTIKVVNAKVTLSKSSMTISEGETKEITVKIESNKQYSASDLKWVTGNAIVTKVETTSSGNNTFKAKVYGLSKGAAWISANIDGEKDRSKITVNEAGRDTSLECPLISYDTSNNEYIKINITPASTTDHFDYAVSTNGMSGKNAKWSNVESNIKGNKIFNSKYDSMQGKIRIYGKSGSSRDCYTAPFDYDSSKSATKLRSYSGFMGICPSVSLNKNTEYISGAKSYKMKSYGNSTVITGIKNVNLTISPASNTNYQYSWYTNKNGVVNHIERDAWQLNRTFNGSSSVSISTDTNYYRQGNIILINELGDIRTCYTDLYSNAAYSYYAEKGSTKVVTKAGETCIGSDNTISYINTLYKNSPYLFKNKMINISGNRAVTYGTWVDSFVDLPCNDENTYIGVIHEMAHVWDRTTGAKYESRISSNDEMKKLMNKYNNSQNLVTNSNLYCSYDWYYDQKDEFEFFAGIYTHYYLDKYYKNKSDAEIDKLHIHDCWKWMLKNKNIDSDIKSFIEKNVSKYR